MERDIDEELAWEVYGEGCPIHEIYYRSDLGPCPYCKKGSPAPEAKDGLDPRGFPGDD